MKNGGWTTNYMDDIGISTYLSTKQCDIRSRALHWVPIPMPTHVHGFWVGMGAILLVILLVMLQFLNTWAQIE